MKKGRCQDYKIKSVWVRKPHLRNIDSCCYPRQRKAGFTALVTYLKGYTRHVAVRRINRLFPLNCPMWTLSGRIIIGNLIYPRPRPTTPGRRSLWVSRWGGCLKKAWGDPKNSIETWSQENAQRDTSSYKEQASRDWFAKPHTFWASLFWFYFAMQCNFYRFGQGDLNLFAINLK